MNFPTVSKNLKKYQFEPLLSLFVVGVVVATLVIPRISPKLPESFVLSKTAALYLTPTELGAAAGSSFPISVSIDTGGNPIVGADVRVFFDSNVLELVQIVPNTNGNLHVFYPVVAGATTAFDNQKVIDDARDGSFTFGASSAVIEQDNLVRLDRQNTEISLANLTFKVKSITGTFPTTIGLAFESGDMETDSNLIALEMTENSIPQEVLGSVSTTVTVTINPTGVTQEVLPLATTTNIPLPVASPTSLSTIIAVPTASTTPQATQQVSATPTLSPVPTSTPLPTNTPIATTATRFKPVPTRAPLIIDQ